MTMMGAALLSSMAPMPALGQRARNPTGYLRTNWSRDPFAYGAYSYVAKGSRQRDRRRLESPVGDRLFFAGEAAYPFYNSTVHAAHESGLRTAEAVRQTDAGTVAIIGAGMSGLSAAHRLARQGLAVTVFEARDRIGGRLWADDGLGPPLDLGASWIHGVNGNPMSDAAGQLGLPTAMTGDDYLLRGRGGAIIDDRDTPGWLENVVSVQHTFGADTDQINRWAYALQDDYGGGDAIVPASYARVLDAFKGDYEVRTNAPVTAIEHGAFGASVAVDAQAPKRFDCAIVTVPLGVLKRGAIRFDPKLPADKQRAIDRLGMGTLDKLYLRYDEAFWDRDVTWIITPDNGLPQGQFNQWLNLHKLLGEPIIMAFNGGPPALDLAAKPDEEILSRAIATLAAAYPA